MANRPSFSRRTFLAAGAAGGLAALSKGRGISSAPARRATLPVLGAAEGSPLEAGRALILSGRLGALTYSQAAHDGHNVLETLALLLYVTGSELPDRVSALGAGGSGGTDLQITAVYRGGHTLVLTPPLAGLRGIPTTVRGARGMIEILGSDFQWARRTNPGRGKALDHAIVVISMAHGLVSAA